MALIVGEQVHNEFRKKHGSPPLYLNDKLNEEAQKYARALVSGAELPEEIPGLGRNEYQSNGEEGEPWESIVADAVTEWYEYISEYNWESPTSSPDNALLFSQVVWASSSNLGIGIACQGEDMVVIAVYSPGGNIPSDEKHKENVHKPIC